MPVTCAKACGSLSEYVLRRSAFLAGKCFVRYQRRRGRRKSPLLDFYIGAHAAVAGLVLLTRDATRYRIYFPGVEIIAP